MRDNPVTEEDYSRFGGHCIQVCSHLQDSSQVYFFGGIHFTWSLLVHRLIPFQSSLFKRPSVELHVKPTFWMNITSKKKEIHFVLNNSNTQQKLMDQKPHLSPWTRLCRLQQGRSWIWLTIHPVSAINSLVNLRKVYILGPYTFMQRLCSECLI